MKSHGEIHMHILSEGHSEKGTPGFAFIHNTSVTKWLGFFPPHQQFSNFPDTRDIQQLCSSSDINYSNSTELWGLRTPLSAFLQTLVFWGLGFKSPCTFFRFFIILLM